MFWSRWTLALQCQMEIILICESKLNWNNPLILGLWKPRIKFQASAFRVGIFKASFCSHICSKFHSVTSVRKSWHCQVAWFIANSLLYKHILAMRFASTSYFLQYQITCISRRMNIAASKTALIVMCLVFKLTNRKRL